MTENVDQSDSPNFLPGPSPLPQSCLLLNGSELLCPLRGPQPATELEELNQGAIIILIPEEASNPKGEDIIPSSLFSNGADDLHTTDEALDGEERIQQ